MLEGNELLGEQEIVQIKRSINALKREAPPTIITHNMIDDGGDPILNKIRSLNLCNWDTDKVKIVFHPEFLSPNNPILGMEYKDFIRGCHLGCFPSYYEPWGYTPAECTVSGVPSVTTNLSGFGCFIEEHVKSPNDYGIYVLNRRGLSSDDSINELANYMFSFCQKTRRQRISLRNRTERLSEILDWKSLGIEYEKARRLALFEKFISSPYVAWNDINNDDDRLEDYENENIQDSMITRFSNNVAGSPEITADEFVKKFSRVVMAHQ